MDEVGGSNPGDAYFFWRRLQKQKDLGRLTETEDDRGHDKGPRSRRRRQ